MKDKSIVLAIDFGSSLTKAIYQVSNRKRKKLLIMSPSVSKVSISELRRQNSAIQLDKPLEHSSWVRTCFQSEEDALAVGFLAEQFGRSTSMKPLKYENAVYKVLAAIGVIVNREQLLDGPVHVHLMTLLPYGEYGNSEQLHSLASQTMRYFSFQGHDVEAILDFYMSVPESSGLIELKTTGAFEYGKSMALMFGHRNMSGVVFDRGQLVRSESYSTHLGFHHLVNAIAERSPVRSLSGLTKLLYGLDVSSDLIPFTSSLLEGLCSSLESHNRRLEQRILRQAITEESRNYWNKLRRHISIHWPSDVESLLIGGGAAEFSSVALRTGIPKVEHYWAKEHQEGLIKDLGLDHLSCAPSVQSSLAMRLLDVYGAYHYLQRHLKLCKPRRRASKTAVAAVKSVSA